MYYVHIYLFTEHFLSRWESLLYRRCKNKINKCMLLTQARKRRSEIWRGTTLLIKNFNNCIRASYGRVLQSAARYVLAKCFSRFFIYTVLNSHLCFYKCQVSHDWLRTTDHARQVSINICTRSYLLERSFLGRDNKLHR